MDDTKISVDDALIHDDKATFVLHRTGNLTAESAVRYHSVDGSAIGKGDLPKAGADFQHVMGTIVFGAGEASKQVDVALLTHQEAAKTFSFIIDATSFGVIERGNAVARLGTARELPMSSIDSVTMGDSSTIAPPPATPANVAFDKALTALFAKYGKGADGLDQGTMLGLAANATGRLIAVQDLRTNPTDVVMAAVNVNIAAGYQTARAKLNTLANLGRAGSTPPPSPALAKVLSGAPTGNQLN